MVAKRKSVGRLCAVRRFLSSRTLGLVGTVLVIQRASLERGRWRVNLSVGTGLAPRGPTAKGCSEQLKS